MVPTCLVPGTILVPGKLPGPSGRLTIVPSSYIRLYSRNDDSLPSSSSSKFIAYVPLVLEFCPLTRPLHNDISQTCIVLYLCQRKRLLKLQRKNERTNERTNGRKPRIHQPLSARIAFTNYISLAIK